MSQNSNPNSETGIFLSRANEKAAKIAPHAGGPAVRRALEIRDAERAERMEALQANLMDQVREKVDEQREGTE